MLNLDIILLVALKVLLLVGTCGGTGGGADAGIHDVDPLDVVSDRLDISSESSGLDLGNIGAIGGTGGAG
jgi:hypothetical protein